MPNSQPALLCLEVFQVLFLALHDWIPLGRLNDVKSTRAENPGVAFIVITIFSTLPYAIGLAASSFYFDQPWPAWLLMWLRVSYTILFAGELRAWWIPYLVMPEPVRAVRYRLKFGDTHAFLPEHNGITPNMLHVMLHAATLATLILLFLPL